MHKHLIILPDGTEISSGRGCTNAIERVTLTEQVNTGSDLNMGAVCASVLEADLFTPRGALQILPGTELTLYQLDSAGNRTRTGLYTVERLTRLGANRSRITAYDRLSCLDCDLSGWLRSLPQWPCTLLSFARQVCQACGLTLINEEIPNGDWPIAYFSATDVTGRTLMQWVAEACGRFCRATADGGIELAWYTPTQHCIRSSGAQYYFAGSLQAESAAAAPIDRVHIRFTGSDVGAGFGDGSNVYTVLGNPLLLSDSEEAVRGAAEVLYEILHTVSYTPCRVCIDADMGVRAGDMIDIVDSNDRRITMYVMRRVHAGQRDTLVCVGNPTRSSTGARNRAKFTNLSGKVTELEVGLDGLKMESSALGSRLLTLQAGMEGLSVSHTDLGGKTAELELNMDGLSSKVSSQQEGLAGMERKISAMEQDTEGLRLQVKRVVDDGVSKVSTYAGYTFDENGLTVTKSGREIKTQITQDGMTVYKNNRAVLTANSEGVEAVDLSASTYLAIAGKARFEKYKTSRIGCFWIGG